MFAYSEQTESIVMIVPDRLLSGLDSLAKKEKTSIENILRRALGLYAMAQAAKDEGGLIGFCYPEDDQYQINKLINL